MGSSWFSSKVLIMITRNNKFHWEDKKIISTYPPDVRASKYIKQILTDLKGEINNTIIAGDFRISLSTLYITSRLKSIRKH